MCDYIETAIEGYRLRMANENDIPVIIDFIRQLAEYENLSDMVVLTPEVLKEELFGKKGAEVVIGEYQSQPACFSLFFHNFSTFLGQRGIYLEDLFVIPEMRGKGFGKVMLSYLAKLAVERKCGRLEWSCLDWNEPSIKFYKKMGAVPMEEWTVYRLAGERLTELGNRF
ncbi:MAG TPA: GNAT family N-acetyltransferase [Ruminiclostridium sp.]|nr:GNAT family N-acetyltransferase [Ruminiclostridium sp.]